MKLLSTASLHIVTSKIDDGEVVDRPEDFILIRSLHIFKMNRLHTKLQSLLIRSLQSSGI